MNNTQSLEAFIYDNKQKLKKFSSFSLKEFQKEKMSKEELNTLFDEIYHLSQFGLELSDKVTECLNNLSKELLTLKN